MPNGLLSAWWDCEAAQRVQLAARLSCFARSANELQQCALGGRCFSVTGTTLWAVLPLRAVLPASASAQACQPTACCYCHLSTCSYGTFLKRLQDPVIAAVEQRVASECRDAHAIALVVLSLAR